MFMLTKQGRVQFWQQDGWTGMVLAEQPEALHEFRRQHCGDKKPSIAEIGTVEGETLEGQLHESFRNGANCAFVIHGVEKDNITFRLLKLAPRV